MIRTALLAAAIAAVVATPAAFAQMPHGMPNLGDMFLKQFDANHDGKVTRDEFIKPTEAQFDHMDTNGDGAVDASELETMQTEMMQRMQQHGGQH